MSCPSAKDCTADKLGWREGLFLASFGLAAFAAALLTWGFST